MHNAVNKESDSCRKVTKKSIVTTPDCGTRYYKLIVEREVVHAMHVTKCASETVKHPKKYDYRF